MRVRTKHQSGPYDTRLRALEPRPDFVGRSVSAGVAAMMRRLAWYCASYGTRPSSARQAGARVTAARFGAPARLALACAPEFEDVAIFALCLPGAGIEAHLPFVRREFRRLRHTILFHPLQKRAAKEIRSRGADASELCPTTTKIRVLGQNRGERSAERRIQPMSAQHQTDVAACRCPGADARRRQVRAVCANLPASGRARLPAHRCGSRRDFDIPAQLQAMLPGTWSRRALPVLSCPSPAKAPRASVVMPKRMMPKAARERFAKPRAGTASRSANRIASGMRPSGRAGFFRL